MLILRRKEFSNATQKALRKEFDAGMGKTLKARVHAFKELAGEPLLSKDAGGIRYRNLAERNISRGRLFNSKNWASDGVMHFSKGGKNNAAFLPINTVNKIPGDIQRNKRVMLENLRKLG